MIKLRPEELAAFSKYIHSITGIALDEKKGYLIESRLSGLATELGCATFSELYFKARADAGGLVRRKVIDAITTGETTFFRDTSPFELFRHKILPDVIDARSGTTPPGRPIPINIWSAACSTGQEVYSIAIAIRESLGDLSGYDIKILGTDIADKAIAAASRGIYSKVEIERGMPMATLGRWFTSTAGQWKIADELRSLATFRQLNLMDSFANIGKFDIVFCRNVAIYFSEPDKASVFRRIAAQLDSHGALVIGSTESISGICPEFESKRYMRSVFYQLRGKSAGSGAAGAPGIAGADRPRPAAISASPAVSSSIARPAIARPASSPTTLSRPGTVPLRVASITPLTGNAAARPGIASRLPGRAA
jgi:chemotaxis methyl-accepting protein methylase